MKDERCKNCYYWDTENIRVENNKNMASCLHDTPKVFMFSPQALVTMRPQTPDMGRCGKFREGRK